MVGPGMTSSTADAATKASQRSIGKGMLPQREGSTVAVARILRRLPTVVKTVVSQHLRDAQPVVGKDTGAAFVLPCAMQRVVAPAPNRLLVAPEAQRQVAAALRQALEALDRDEAVDPGKLLSQRRGDLEVAP